MATVKQSAYSYAVRGNDTAKGQDPNASYWSTFNPFSQFSSSNPVDRIPEWLDKLPVNISRDTKYLIWKATALSLLATAIVGGGRLLLHTDKVNKVRKNDAPGHKLNSQLNASFEMSDTPKTWMPKNPEECTDDSGNTEEQIKTAADWWGAAIPGGIAVIVGALAYAATDAWADKRKGEILKKRMEGKSNYLKDLIVARGQNARGTLTPDEYSKALLRPDFEENGVQYKEGALNKRAVDKWTDSIPLFLGTIGAALFAVTAYGSYKYHEANNPNNIRYRAYKKGLEEYAAIRSRSNPLTIGVAGNQIFNRIDEPPAPNKKVRMGLRMNLEPEAKGAVSPELLLDDKHTPVSVTI